ncbi:farnesyl cysteine-carboxyl methyltransferase [Conoideocrella luteorostrata]|uniref:Protein-S-isoprenylcysteine O-methyltransferase n=1 Tax=Conoideocrella luteorostrata TaxID=1105319 RepID=A0AAJ0CUS2_9HYPO|nr:farnesyl cysteine-carboxyl methyltransferase [Conoideocrella luteorostrata]
MHSERQAQNSEPRWSSHLNFDHRHTITHPRRPTWNNQPLKQLYPNQPMSLSGISLRAFILGTAFSSALLSTVAILALSSSPLWRIPFFLSALSLFHFLEFWTTAERNTPEATVSAFLLTSNWPAYPIAHSMACLECLITNTLFPNRHWAPAYASGTILAVGLAMVVAGQLVRSLAMLHAGTNFNHTVQTRKADSHTLVTTGVYSVLRHPSYFGFFYWGLGTQLVLGNGACFVAHGFVLWKFFSSRVRLEEQKLVEFFGDEYVVYRGRVGTMMPFVG